MSKYYFLSGQNFNDFRVLDCVFPNLDQAEDFARSNNYKLFLKPEEVGAYIDQNVYNTEEGEAGWVLEGLRTENERLKKEVASLKKELEMTYKVSGDFADRLHLMEKRFGKFEDQI